jgi:sulfur carrier protein
MPTRSEAEFKIQLNGEPYVVDGDARVAALIQKLGFKRGRVAVEINFAVIPKAEWDNVMLRPGDTVEVVNFVGGG